MVENGGRSGGRRGIDGLCITKPKAWGMRSAERRKVNVLEMKCLRSLVGVSRMDK